MCNQSCFLICFTIRAGSVFMSSIFLFLGLLGCYSVPQLPYSINDARFLPIMIYMLLLVLAFGVALGGALMYNKYAMGFGLWMGIIAFVFWLILTMPTLIYFRQIMFDNNYFCLGHKCGETHWLVPRDWTDDEYWDQPPTPRVKPDDPDQYFDDYLNLNKNPPFPGYKIQNPIKDDDIELVINKKSRDKAGPNVFSARSNVLKLPSIKIAQRKGNDRGWSKKQNPKLKSSRDRIETQKKTLPRKLGTNQPPVGLNRSWSQGNQTTTKKNIQHTTQEYISTINIINITTTTVEDDQDWLELANSLLLDRKKRSRILPDRNLQHSRRKRYIAEIVPEPVIGPFIARLHHPRFSGNQEAVISLTRVVSIFLALLYALLFICALVTFYFALGHFTRTCGVPPKGYCGGVIGSGSCDLC